VPRYILDNMTDDQLMSQYEANAACEIKCLCTWLGRAWQMEIAPSADQLYSNREDEESHQVVHTRVTYKLGPVIGPSDLNDYSALGEATPRYAVCEVNLSKRDNQKSCPG
jgi:hypothetical protein